VPIPQALKEFIDSCQWTFAKTMPEWPHEYIVRKRVDENLFVRLVRHIRANGYEEKFYEKTITYYDDRGIIYWTMGAPIDETTIINRCRKEDSYEHRKLKGTLPESKALAADHEIAGETIQPARSVPDLGTESAFQSLTTRWSRESRTRLDDVLKG
jgi:hypothetical protein